MQYKRILYYDQERKPLPLGLLKYNRFYNKIDIFIAADEAKNYDELFERLKKVLSSEVIVRDSTDKYICFLVDGNNLKFKVKHSNTLL